MVKKRPDTEPPEEERPDTTTTPLLVEKGKMLPKAVKFTAETLLRWLEDLAVQHDKKKMGENAWQYVQALVLEMALVQHGSHKGHGEVDSV